MKTPLQQAIEESQLTAHLNAARVFFKLSPEMTRLIQQVVEETVEIAEQHLRAMIAEEIRARKSAGYNTQQREWNDAIEHAARIAEGDQP